MSKINQLLLQKALFTLIMVIIAVNLYINRSYFLTPYNHQKYSDLYSRSQYVLGPAAKEGIGDDGLYAFAGYYYLIDRGDVSGVNFEHPPLGKYLIGLSILLFKNQIMINIFYLFFILWFTYKLADIIFRNNLLSTVTILILILNPLFQDHLIRSLLDLPFALFFLAGIYYFLLGLAKPKLLCLSSFFWGLVFSTKFFPGIIFIYAVLGLIIFIYRKKFLSLFLLSSLFVPLIYLLTHISFFVYHPSIIEFLRHKKWMIDWWRGSPIIPGNILRHILTGTYLDSLGVIRTTKEWNLLIPTVFILALGRIRKKDFQLKNIAVPTIYALTFIYLLVFLTFFNGGGIRFTLPIYPLAVILALDNLRLIYYSLKSSGISVKPI